MNEWMNEWMMCVQRTAPRSAMVSVAAAVQAVLLPLKPPTIMPPAFCGNTESANGPAATWTAIIQPSFSGHSLHGCIIVIVFGADRRYRRPYILPVFFIFIVRFLISQPARRLPPKLYRRLDSRLNLEKLTQTFCPPLPDFYREERKVRNLASMFDSSYLWVALVSKRSNMLEI